MTRSWLLLFVLIFILLTYQLEWKEQLENEVDNSLILTEEEQHIPKAKESLQEKIILSRENNIHKLNEVIQDLRRQLQQCKNEKKSGRDGEEDSNRA
ncbi:unnamed protein product [Cochlearia groenlandica]